MCVRVHADLDTHKRIALAQLIEKCVKQITKIKFGSDSY